ncbi:MAG: sugar ABC transporter ATP-binding protein [Thermoleophilia bacterium]|nr:sugar ABC transporter ATP-binding protein [Thermoleophilia bacterium]
MDGATDVKVQVRGVSKYYPGTCALDDVNLDIVRGSVHALVGANGAGKSTLGMVIGGAIPADKGDIILDGKPIRLTSSREGLRHGIARVAQELALCPLLSVVQNVFLGVESKRFGRVLRGEMRRRYDELVAEAGFALDPDIPVERLSSANQQKVEILRAVGRKASLIIMDEPTSSLTKDEVAVLQKLIEHLKEQGRTIVYVSHYLEEVLAVADTVTVMRNGRIVRTSPAKDETPATLVSGMFGIETAEETFPPKAPLCSDDIVLEACGLNREGTLNDVSLSIRRGEIVGLAGLVGSGRSEVARAIAGVDRMDSGTIRVEGAELKLRGPKDAIRAGVAFVPESRKAEGLCLGRSLSENITLPHHWAGVVSRAGFLGRRTERTKVEEILRALSVQPPRAAAIPNELSGGNQQKVVMCKCLFRTPKVLVLDEPTRGVDVNARRAIHGLITDLAKQGVGVLLISSDIEEVLGLSHRVLVLRGHRVIKEFPTDPEMADIMNACFGLPTAIEASA